MHALVHENLPGELKGFQRYWKDYPVYLDEEKNFFKALGDRWLGIISGFTSSRVWKNVDRAKNGGYKGNLKGEGRLLGGVLVVGKGDEGVLADFREEVWGDHADPKDILEACKKIGKNQEK
mmetsp:Transcript_21149/g.29644  ORF Transcript_21149/g.29644 Transcript_21149/m.29644 type:complete len:121 (-) Transcript_21149:215-577(-)